MEDSITMKRKTYVREFTAEDIIEAFEELSFVERLKFLNYIKDTFEDM
jgi:hypothetical protein